MRRSQKKWFIVIILKTDDEMGIRRANFLLFCPFQNYLFPILRVFSVYALLLAIDIHHKNTENYGYFTQRYCKGYEQVKA